MARTSRRYSWLKARWQQVEDWRQAEVESFYSVSLEGGLRGCFLIIAAPGTLVWVLEMDREAGSSFWSGPGGQRANAEFRKASVQPRAMHQRCHWAKKSCCQYHVKDNTRDHRHWSTYCCWCNVHGYINKDIDEETVSVGQHFSQQPVYIQQHKELWASAYWSSCVPSLCVYTTSELWWLLYKNRYRTGYHFLSSLCTTTGKSKMDEGQLEETTGWWMHRYSGSACQYLS